MLTARTYTLLLGEAYHCWLLAVPCPPCAWRESRGSACFPVGAGPVHMGRGFAVHFFSQNDPHNVRIILRHVSWQKMVSNNFASGPYFKLLF